MASRVRPVTTFLIGALTVLLVLTAGGPRHAAATDEPRPVGEHVTVEELDGFRGATPPLRVRTGATVELFDAYGTLIPLTDTGIPGVAGIPALLDGTYVLRGEGLEASFTIEGTGAVPNDPGPRTPARQGRWLWPSLLAVAGGALLLRRRTRPLALLFVGGAVALYAYTGTSGAVEGMTMRDCAAVHPDPSKELAECAFDRGAALVDAGRFPDALAELENAGIGTCHEIAHRLGVRSWLASPSPVTEVIAPGYDLCNDAFYHGALYGAAIYLDDEQFARVAIDACDIIHPEQGPGGGACAHGIGHSLTVRFGGHFDRVREACRNMKTTFQERVLECEGAGLMEYAVLHSRAGSDATRLPQPYTPPEELCAEAGPDMQAYCYGGLAMSKTRSDRSAVELLEMCAAIEDGDRRIRCVEGVVPEFRSHLQQSAESAGVCLTVTGEARQVCARQYAYFSYDQYQDADFSLSICRTSRVSEDVCRMAIESSRPWAETD